MIRTTLRLIALALSLGTSLPAAAQTQTTDAPQAGAKGTYINPNVPTVEATDANGVPLTALVTVLDGQAPDGPHMLTILFAIGGYKGASIDSLVLPTRGSCIEAGAGHLRVLLLSRVQSVDEGIERGGNSIDSNMLNVSSFPSWVQVTCQPITQN